MKLILCAAVLLGLLVVTTAAVQANGANVYHGTSEYSNAYGNCYQYPTHEYCYEYEYSSATAYHRVLTPSGNYKYQIHDDYNYDYHSWMTDLDTGDQFNDFTYSHSDKEHHHYLLKQNGGSVYHMNDRDTVEDSTQKCVTSVVYQFVEGEVRTDRLDVDCKLK